MTKHLWEVTYKLTYNTTSFQVITDEKNVEKVPKAAKTFFSTGSSYSVDDIVNIQYIGKVYE